jgi:hypothetical protein
MLQTAKLERRLVVRPAAETDVADVALWYAERR